MVFAPLTKREYWNWHNIIALCERIHNWKRNRLFKETFFAAILDSKAPEAHEHLKQPIRDIVLKYRPNPEEWWYPEIVEYFYPDYLQSKAGAYFTPKAYCELLAKIAQKYIKPEWREEGLTAYDPACGVGALLITFRQLEPQATVYGQELDHESVLIAQELLTNKKGGDFKQESFKRKYTRPSFYDENNKWITGGQGEKTGKIRSGDTLKHDKFKRKFHVVLANPPFNQELKDKEIIKKYGTNKGNIAWVKQVIRRMKPDGVGLIILPGGILATDNFKEGRKYITKYNRLDAIFYNFRKENNKRSSEGQHRFSNAETDTCFLVLRKRKRSEQLISFIDCENKTLGGIVAIWKQRERVEISRQEIKKNDYNFLGFILRLLDDQNGQEIAKMFKWTLSRRKGQKLTGNFIKINKKNWNSQNEPLSELTGRITAIPGQEYLYLTAKDGDISKLERLKNYLDHNRNKQLKFYQGAIIKHLMTRDFLKWKIDLLNDLYAQPHAREETETQKNNYDDREKENYQESNQ